MSLKKMEIEDNLIEQKEQKERFIFRKPIRVLTLILLYSIIITQTMITNVFNTSNSSIRASLESPKKLIQYLLSYII